VRRWQLAQSSSRSWLESAAEKMYVTAPVTGQSLRNWIDANLVVPVSVILFRLGKQFRMGAVGYGRTGFAQTAFGSEDLMVQRDAVRKVLFLHFSMRLACVVPSPQDFALSPDVVIMGYDCGYEGGFISADEWDPTNPDYSRKSIIASVIPYGSEARLRHVINFTGRIDFNRKGLKARVYRAEDYRDPCYESAFFESVRFRTNEMRTNIQYADGSFNIGLINNTTAYRDAYFQYDPMTGMLTQLVQPQDVFGADGTTTGSLDAIRGAAVPFKPFISGEASSVM
jgi:hypothetical protein